ncbi:serine hydrolase domain-containing protein [Algoriphagus formosus]|uniref:Class A beta-lactamase-related serine hydrolase n=1 Tax=Algoriphagus formosus TaxID=2007308 RepID=A0A4R5V8U0_9BACT|nr:MULTISPECIES: serine hydrolase domain-containing protein [Algoriphagus]TDK47966.1 class A beta-lactamase-related serine hydrolase [Algoriphagus aquimaris]
MKKLALIFILYINAIGISFAQLNADQVAAIDSVFRKWNQPGMPGGSVAVMQDGRVLYSKAFGLASIDFGVPNSPNTLFNIASVSKQFTAMAIVRMAEKGLLSLDDEVQKYLPEVPDFGQPITFRHLIHHSSGLRSVHDMLGLAGWRGDDLRTNEDVFRFVTLQKDLNYPVGERFGYCNTGYVLMALVVEGLSGKSFAEWIKNEVFDPLGMTHTYVEDNYTRVIPGNAFSYYHSQGAIFERAMDYWNYTGAGNIHSTTEDLLYWAKNLYRPTPGWENAFEQIKEVGIYSNGQPSNYAFGLFVDEFNGHKRIHHSGSIGGFRAQLATFPESRLSIVMLSNYSSSNLGQRLTRLSEIILGTDLSSQDQSIVKAKEADALESNDSKLFVGKYWDTYEKQLIQILAGDSGIVAKVGESEFLLNHLGNGTFAFPKSDGRELRFEIEEGEVNGARLLSKEEIINPLILLGENAFSVADLENFEGEFYSEELQTSYWFSVNGEGLVAYHPRHGEIPLERLTANAFRGSWPVLTVEFFPDSEGKVKQVKLSNGRVKNLRLSRLD